MRMELLKDKSKVGKEKYRAFEEIDEAVVKDCLKKYIERCKFKYVMAFLQWRSMQYEANFVDLE